MTAKEHREENTRRAGEVNLAQAHVSQCEDGLKRNTLRYVERFPLTRVRKVFLRNRVGENVRFESLCCPPGVTWLLENGFDSLWTQVINEWAYEAISCNGADSAEYNLEKLERAFESNFGLNYSNQTDNHEDAKEAEPMKNVIERVSELEAALRKRSPIHELNCDASEKLQPDRVTMKARGKCTCGHADAMKVLGDDVLSVSITIGPNAGYETVYRFYLTRDGATCVDLDGSLLETFSRSSGAVQSLMRELTQARDKLIDLQGHAR